MAQSFGTPLYTFEQIHSLSEQVEQAAIASARSISPQTDVDVLVHVEPTASPGETLIDQIHYLAERQGVHAHDIHAREVNGRLEADFRHRSPCRCQFAGGPGHSQPPGTGHPRKQSPG